MAVLAGYTGMIHYHGTPITPNSAALAAISGGHAFISFARPDQLGITLDVCQSFAVDNGAFSAWKSGSAIVDWSRYYAWVAELHRYPSFDFAVIPDVIDGSEDDNDALLASWPWRNKSAWVGASLGLRLTVPLSTLRANGLTTPIDRSQWYLILRANKFKMR